MRSAIRDGVLVVDGSIDLPACNRRPRRALAVPVRFLGLAALPAGAGVPVLERVLGDRDEHVVGPHAFRLQAAATASYIRLLVAVSYMRTIRTRMKTTSRRSPPRKCESAMIWVAGSAWITWN